MTRYARIACARQQKEAVVKRALRGHAERANVRCGVSASIKSVQKKRHLRPRMSREAISRYAMIAYARQQRTAVVDRAIRREADEELAEQCSAAESMTSAPSSHRRHLRPRMSREAMSRYALGAYERQQRRDRALRSEAEEQRCSDAAPTEEAPSSKRHLLVRVGKPKQCIPHDKKARQHKETGSATQQTESRASSENANVAVPLCAPVSATPIGSSTTTAVRPRSTLKQPDRRLYVPPHMVKRQYPRTRSSPNPVYDVVYNDAGAGMLARPGETSTTLNNVTTHIDSNY